MEGVESRVLSPLIKKWKLYLEMQPTKKLKKLLRQEYFKSLDLSIRNLRKEEVIAKMLDHIRLRVVNKSLYPALPCMDVVDDRVLLNKLEDSSYWRSTFKKKVAYEVLGKPKDMSTFQEKVIKNSKSVAVIAPKHLLQTEVSYRQRVIGRNGGGRNTVFKGRFGEQRSIGYGTAFLIAPDILLTTKHTFDQIDPEKWEDLRYVFGWSGDGEGDMLYDSQFTILEGELIRDSCSGTLDDYAMIRLKEKVEFDPLIPDLNPRSSLKGRWMYTLGYPGGIPQVLAVDGKWVQGGSYTFTTNLDVFGGNSGSPIFDLMTHEVLGMLLKGADDYHRKGNIITEKRYRYEDARDGHDGEICHRISYLHHKLGRYFPRSYSFVKL